MPTIMQSATKGRRSALTALYQQNKKTVYFLCHAILRDPADAADGTAWAFKSAWPSVLEGKLESQKSFSSHVIKKAAFYCKTRIAKYKPKSLKVSVAKSFAITAIAPSNIDKSSDKLDTVLDLLPEPQRFVLVLHTIAGCSTDEIAHILSLNAATIKLIQEAEIPNLARIYEAVQKAGGNALPATKELLKIRFDAAFGCVQVPPAMEASILDNIQTLTAPAEKRIKKRNMRIAAVGVAVCVIGIMLTMIFKGSSPEHDADTSTDLEATAGEFNEEASDANADAVDASDEEPILPTVSEMHAQAIEASVARSSYYADITIANYGTITVALDAESAPETVTNFVELAQSGFYDGLTFHRIIDGFMMQGGDPNGDGTGGSENTIVGEFQDNGYANTLAHLRGAISMARSNDYDSASSQFFIVQEDSDFLDGQYACFGYVTEGMEIVDAICEAAEPIDEIGTIATEAQPIITSIEIREKAQASSSTEID